MTACCFCGQPIHWFEHPQWIISNSGSLFWHSRCGTWGRKN